MERDRRRKLNEKLYAHCIALLRII